MIGTPKIVLCIPGPWPDRLDLLARIVRDSGGDLFAGRILLHMDSGEACELQYEPHDTRMVAAFAAAGPHWRGSAEMARIGTHASVVYLIGAGGSRVRAEAMMRAAAALLHTFTRYLFTEAPDLREGHSFSVAQEAPRYRIEAEASTQFRPGDLFANPYGLWRLTPL